MREQFFNPNRFHPGMPLSCQMVLGSDTLPRMTKSVWISGRSRSILPSIEVSVS